MNKIGRSAFAPMADIAVIAYACRMSPTILTSLATAALVAFTPPAQACRVFLAPEARIANAYAQNEKLQVAVVQITQAQHLSFPITRELRRLHRGYEEPWRVTASVTRLVTGEQSPELLTFDRGWGSAACDDGTKMPNKGDEWIVYYLAGPNGQADVLVSYPLKAALQADRRLRASGS